MDGNIRNLETRFTFNQFCLFVWQMSKSKKHYIVFKKKFEKELTSLYYGKLKNE